MACARWSRAGWSSRVRGGGGGGSPPWGTTRGSARRGAELLARGALEALRAATTREADRARARDARARRTEFRGKWMVERLISGAVGFAPAINYFARTLEARKDMADLLVGVTGDFVPAREVLRPGYLLNLFRPSSSSPAPGA